MKLYDNPLSPYAMKIRLILYEKGIEFEKIEIREEAQREELLRLNPRAEVPALVDGSNVIYDSKVIAEYLEEVQPTPALLPKDLGGRALCRGLELFADNQLDAAVLAYSIFKFFRPKLAEERPEALQRAEAAVHSLYSDLDRRLEGRDYFVDQFSRADIALVPHLNTCGFLGLSPGEDTPNLATWLARVNEREPVQRVTQEAISSLSRKDDKPFFDNDRLHWRSDRIEQMLRIGMGPWLLEELGADRAFLPPLP